MNGTILIVDDQPDLLDNLSLTLTAVGYNVLTAPNGLVALETLEQHLVNLIIADIAMPQMNGYQLFERIRQNPQWLMIPFIFLTARAMDSDIRYGKELGVDDYLTKPIQPEDLIATVTGKLRRAQQLEQMAPTAGTDQNLEVGILQIDLSQHQVLLGDRNIKLSVREFTILEILTRHANEVVSPEELIKATHNLTLQPTEAGSLLRPLIRSLRRKLGYQVGETGCIENLRGVGYRLIPPQQQP